MFVVRFSSYSAKFTPVLIPDSDFSSGRAFRKYQSEMVRRMAGVADLLSKTEVLFQGGSYNAGGLAEIYIVGGNIVHGGSYIFARRASNTAYRFNGDSLWLATYDIAAGSEDPAFIEELRGMAESGTVDVVKTGCSESLFVVRTADLMKKKWKIMYDPSVLEQELMSVRPFDN